MCKTPSLVCLLSRCSRSKWSRRAAAGFSHCLQTSSCHIWNSCCARLTALSSQWPCRQAFSSGSLALNVICACTSSAGSLALHAICACAVAMHGCSMLEGTLLLSRRLLYTQGSTLSDLCIDLCGCTNCKRPYHYMLSAVVLCGVHPEAGGAVPIMSKLYTVVAPRCQ